MKLNERIERGRTSLVAQSFQAAEENALDAMAHHNYLREVKKAPPNSAFGRLCSAASRKEKSKEHDGRLMMAIINAVMNDGAYSLRTLVEALETAKVSTRRGGKWTVSLVAHELTRLGTSMKTLRARSNFEFDPKATTWSENAFWNVVNEEKDLARRKGEWRSAVLIPLDNGAAVRHSQYGIGRFERQIGAKLYCRFQMQNGNFEIAQVSPIEIEYFKWLIPTKTRDEALKAIREKYLTDDQLVKVRSLTISQLKARQAVIRRY